MGSGSSRPIFLSLPETELLKLYFTTDNHNIHNINFKLSDGRFVHNVTSMMYYLQFVSNDRVVDEVSIKCTYSINTNSMSIKLTQHLASNKTSDDDLLDIYEHVQIGFPMKRYITEGTISIQFSRVGINTFMISLIHDNKKKNIGILVFKNININDEVTIEPIVRCSVRTRVNITDDTFSNLVFLLHTPSVNNMSDRMNLSYQYRLSTSIDKISNTIRIFDMGIEPISFNVNNATIYSMVSQPKTQIAVKYVECDGLLTYMFRNHSIVY